MRMAGILLIAIACSMMGLLAASNLSARLRRLENCVLLLGDMRGRLEYLQPSVESLISLLAGQQRFENLGFLGQCAALMRTGQTFQASWRQALQKQAHTLGKEEAEILCSLGDVLGQSDLATQLAAIELACLQLQQRITGAREKVAAQSGLYRQVGLLGGAAVAIILM